MMAIRRRLRRLVVAVGLIPVATLTHAAAAADAGTTPTHGQVSAESPRGTAARGDLQVSIDEIDPIVLEPDRPITLSGVVVNVGTRNWADAQVYLEIGQYPAVSPQDLQVFAETDDVFMTRVIEFGQFDEIGNVPAGTRKSYSVTVPFESLGVLGTPGVYSIGVSVLAGRGENRNQPKAIARTLIPLLPERQVKPAPIVTMLPLTAPVTRDSRGVFVTDHLARDIGFNGRLRNVLDFAMAAPPNTLQIALDPALRSAVAAMSEGYEVQRTLAGQPNAGAGAESAQLWLNDLDTVTLQQHVVLLPWGTPAATNLTSEGLPGVVEAATTAAVDYDQLPRPTDVVGWEPGGSNQRGLVVSRSAGSTLQLVTESSLPGLPDDDAADTAPASVELRTLAGPLTALVVHEEIAGEPIRRSTSALAVRQYLMAEATVQALQERTSPVVLGLPFTWNPGPLAATTDLVAGLSIATLSAQPISAAAPVVATPYDGRVVRPPTSPNLSDDQLDAIRQLRRSSRTYLAILADTDGVEATLGRQFAISGSSAWETAPVRGKVLTRREVRLLNESLRQVTVAVPTFVALSSGSGPFPVTVSNGLDVPVTVRLSVRPRNPALQIDPIDELRLEPGQQRDVQVRAHADGSGLTPVRVQLTTPDDRPFGPRSEIDVRATQIGLAIWIVMGVGLVVLVGAAIIRIIRRLRSPGAFTPREEPRHP
jgi:Family of unknown function (DUF6049)